MARTSLRRHPDSMGKAVRAIEVEALRMPNAVEVTYVMTGDLDSVRIPAATGARRADGLWQHTCCELFVAETAGKGYIEFNFSPSGEWACYGFSSYRHAAANPGNEPAVSVLAAAGSLELRARVKIASPRKLALGLSAVIEEKDGAFSYWALRHPAGKPDFHHRDAFALELDELRN